MHTEETGKNFNKRYVPSEFLQEQRVDMENVHDIVDESSHPLSPRFEENSKIYKYMKFENIENVFNITQKLIKEQSEEILNAGLPVTLMDKINTLQR